MFTAEKIQRATQLVYWGLRVPRGTEGDELAARVIDRVISRGEAVWHAAAQITGKRCMCADCSP